MLPFLTVLLQLLHGLPYVNSGVAESWPVTTASLTGEVRLVEQILSALEGFRKELFNEYWYEVYFDQMRTTVQPVDLSQASQTIAHRLQR